MTVKVCLVFTSVVLMTLGVAAETKECDLKDVTKGFFCERDYRVLLPEKLVSNVPLYECGPCDYRTEESGLCDDCEEKMKKVASQKDVCPSCFKKPTPVEVCRKTYYFCPDCDNQSMAKGTCNDCEIDFVQETDLAAVEYHCEECPAWSYKPSKCADGDCDAYGRAYVRTCSSSGVFPHDTRKVSN